MNLHNHGKQIDAHLFGDIESALDKTLLDLIATSLVDKLNYSSLGGPFSWDYEDQIELLIRNWLSGQSDDGWAR